MQLMDSSELWVRGHVTAYTTFSMTTLISNILAILAISSNRWVNIEEQATLEKVCPMCISEGGTAPAYVNISASVGLWEICYTPYMGSLSCSRIHYTRQSWGATHEAEDFIAIYIARVIRRSAFSAILGLVASFGASISAVWSVFQPVRKLGLTSTALIVTAGMFHLTTIIIFLACVQNEASHSPPTHPDGNLSHFRHSYGWNFYVLVAAYLSANVAAVQGIKLSLHSYRLVQKRARVVAAGRCTEADIIIANEHVMNRVVRLPECTSV